MKKIDAHLHVAKVLAGYCRRGELRSAGNGMAVWGNGETFRLIPREFGDTDATAERALEVMRENDVERAVLMQGSMYGFQNQYHRELLARYPDRFCPPRTVDPFAADHLETLEYLLDECGMRAVKFEVSSGGGLMGCHEPFSLCSERMMEIFRRIARRKLVVALDVGDWNMPSHQPVALAKIADAFPEMRLVVCHLLAPARDRERELELSLRLLDKPNVWFDLAALPKIVCLPDSYPFEAAQRVIRRAADLVGAGRLMWGSDAPFAAVRDPYPQLADYLETSALFSQEELSAMYYDNAAYVYFSES